MGDSVYPVVQIQIQAQIGGFPECRVMVAQGIELLSAEEQGSALPEIEYGSEASVVLTLSSEEGESTDYVLIYGKILLTATDLALTGESMAMHRTLKIACAAEFADALSPGTLYFAAEAPGSVSTITKALLIVSEVCLGSLPSIRISRREMECRKRIWRSIPRRCWIISARINRRFRLK